MYVIVTNQVNWHRENLLSNREKIGKTQGILKCNLSGDTVAAPRETSDRVRATRCAISHIKLENTHIIEVKCANLHLLVLFFIA